jgi:hypothetical protein
VRIARISVARLAPFQAPLQYGALVFRRPYTELNDDESDKTGSTPCIEVTWIVGYLNNLYRLHIIPLNRLITTEPIVD